MQATVQGYVTVCNEYKVKHFNYLIVLRDKNSWNFERGKAFGIAATLVVSFS